MSPKKFPFTTRALAALPPCAPACASRSDEYSDAEEPGLKLSVGKVGKGGSVSKTWGYRYKFMGRAGFARIGSFPATTLIDARKAAREMRAKLDRGDDPQAARDRLKAMPTFAEFIAEKYLPWARQAKRSVDGEVSKLNLYLLPKFGKRLLCDISAHDIELYHGALREGLSLATGKALSASTANRHLALLSAMFRQALRWGIVDRNPCAGIAQFREAGGRERFLSGDEIGRMFAAMEAEPNKVAVSALKLLLLTGTRREEALQARWEHVDVATGAWKLIRTKNGRTRYVTLNDKAKQLIESLPSRGHSPWLFPGRDPEKPLNNPRKAFTRVLTAAGIDHMRIHDLRHSFASLAVNAGASLFTVQELLGHSSPQMTARYAHLQNATLMKATQGVADAVGMALGESAASAMAAAAAG
jgi:integrase